MCYILQPDWSLLLLVNTQSSLNYKQGMLLVNMQCSLYCEQGDILWYMEQNLQLPVSVWKIIPTCYHRNKGEVENITG